MLGCHYFHWDLGFSLLTKTPASFGDPSQVSSNQILSYYFMDFFILIESLRIWVEGGDPSGEGNFCTVKIGSDRLKHDKIG
jgi:hypothetical protein